MIDALTINFILVILSIIYFITSYLIYKVRKERYLFYYSLTFIFLSLSYLILFYQKILPIWLSFVVMNIMILFSQIFIITGIRVLYTLTPIPKRFLIYITVYTFLMLLFTYTQSNTNIRITIISFTISALLIDLLWVINKNKNKVASQVHKTLRSVIFFSIFNWLSRVYFAFSVGKDTTYVVDQGITTVVYYIIALIFLSIWFALFIWLETTQSVIKLEEKNIELSKLALIDNLTKLANRHYFDHDIEFLTAITNRNKSNISMLMVDLDRFKLVNDTYGHLVGDEVLIHSSRILKDSVRTSDRVYRWGGEEFVIIVPETNNEQAGLVAEKICQNFREAHFDVIGNITVSIGVASYDKDEPLEDWFKRVDLALYQAKQTGRNRWVSWLDDESLPQHFNRFVWTKEFESGNREIDHDHMMLAAQVNQLHDLIVNSYPIDTIHDSITSLTKYIREHFVREETIILSKGFVNYMEHRSIHNRLLSEYEIILKKAMNGDISLAAFMSFLVEKVLINHILEDDKQFFNVVK